MIQTNPKAILDTELGRASKVLNVPQGYVGFCFQPKKFPDQAKTALITTGVGPCHCLVVVENESESAFLCHLDESFTANAVNLTRQLMEILRDGSGVKQPYYSASLVTSGSSTDTTARGASVVQAINNFCQGGNLNGKLDAPLRVVNVSRTDHMHMIGQNNHLMGNINQQKWINSSDGAPGWSDWQRIGGMSPGFSGRRLRHLLNPNNPPRTFIPA
ncbi:hypothetical protein TW81_16900 [Vibrio galatheae]|uniref:Uncharacterized protein n=1 Tax=Vibrio galatheae TaxID=579748 RepID=A0A0F4NFS3_9VIBR|nr:hypothetical protein [Vibrio galatheae]KJY81713.1 hypothetical protein TW81_16900 [Vibrio galatheae]